jgi:hypothetical protein
MTTEPPFKEFHRFNFGVNPLIVGLDARTKGPSPLVGESDISPESELSPKYILSTINLYIYIPKKIISLI